MVGPEGFEPSLNAPKAIVLPDYTRGRWMQRKELHLRPHGYEPCIFAAQLLCNKMVGRKRVGLLIPVFQTGVLPLSLPPRKVKELAFYV